MFCAIQEIRLKKPNKNGAYKKYRVSDTAITMNGGTTHHYGYDPDYDSGRFERPHMEAHRISLHFSYRKDGKPRKRQYSLCTVDWYTLAENLFSLYDWAGDRIERVTDTEGISTDQIYNIVEEKISPLEKEIQRQFHLTDECKAKRERKKLLEEYRQRKAAFAKQYGISEDIYDNVYDAHGTLRDADYLARIQSEFQQEQERHRAWSGYSEKEQRNHSSSSFTSTGGYTEDEKASLKEFYQILSKKFHPDLNPGRDTSAEMQLVNKLKEDWAYNFGECKITNPHERERT